MAIGNVVKKGTTIFVYDERGKQLFTQTGDLHGFTSGTAVIKKESTLFTFNETGRQVATTSAR
jgi:hypothetical protein